MSVSKKRKIKCEVYNRRNADQSEAIDKISELGNTIDEQNSIEQIMAVEGNIRQIYYSSFNKIIGDLSL